MFAGLAAENLTLPTLAAADARVEEGAGATVDFAVTLDAAAAGTVTVDYATADGSAKAGEDYTAASGTLSFAAGETRKTVSVAVLDDAHDEGEETFTLRLSNASGADIADGEAIGTIENNDLMPAALLARIGRATAEQVVTHIEEPMAAPRQRGFRAWFAGRELQPGSERDFALGFVSSFAPMGAGPTGAAPRGGAAPMGMGSHTAGAGAGAFGAGMGGLGGAMGMSGMGGMTGAMGMSGQQAPMSGASAMAGFIVVRAEVPGDDVIDVTLAVGPDGTCACKVSTADGHLASDAPDVRAFEKVLESRLAEAGVRGQTGDDRG